MATCTLKLYKTEITPSRNCVVDSIASYLGGLTPLQTFNDFQYQKIGLDITIKVPLAQEYAIKQNKGNYIDIYQDSMHYYFFILKARWIAQNVIEFVCSLDTLNTFEGYYQIDLKTKIIRQHKDR